MDDILDRVIGERQRQLPGLDLGKIEDVIDQPEQMLAVALNAGQHPAHFFGRLAVDVVHDQFGIAEDGVHRRAQFVTHIGEELRLVFARFCELPALVLDFFEQADVFHGDDGLVCEGRKQLDLLLSEWVHRVPSKHEDTDRRILAQKRHAEACSIPECFLVPACLVLGVG